MRFCVILTLAIFNLQSAFAAELKVVDDRNLVRAVRVVSAPAAVKVTFKESSSSGASISISNIDGVQQDLSASIENNSARFSNVREGTWKLKVPAGMKVAKVEVLE